MSATMTEVTASEMCVVHSKVGGIQLNLKGSKWSQGIEYTTGWAKGGTQSTGKQRAINLGPCSKVPWGSH